jgi:hypothetical protein
MMEQARLGCRVDGGGYSEPHPDADLVASAVAQLPDYLGGRRMAVDIADLARARRHPDFMAGALPYFEPVAWAQSNRHGRSSKTQVIGQCVDVRKGKPVNVDVLVCPVRCRNDAAVIGRARRSYLNWYGALLDLRATFRLGGDLSSWHITDEMPVRAPWAVSANKC